MAMATVFRKKYTRPIPRDAEIFQRRAKQFARWRDAQGKKQIAPITDDGRQIVLVSSTYTAKYRDGHGSVIERSTGCRDKAAARAVLADLVKRGEQVKAGILTPAEDQIAAHQQTPISEHFGAFMHHMLAKGDTKKHREATRSCLNRLAGECSFRRLADLDRQALEQWLSGQTGSGMSARTRNAYQTAMVSFCNWCVQVHRLAANPFAGMPKANEKADRRRERRALTEDELRRLLDWARERPVREVITIRTGPRTGQLGANVRPEVRRRREKLGRERALIYKCLVLTGLRRKELASLTVGGLELDGERPYAVLPAADEKKRRGALIPLRADLVADLRKWLGELLDDLQEKARAAREPVPSSLPADAPVFTVPEGLGKILDRDLRAAGIPKVDDRGRSVDVYAFRHSFGTHLGKGGVPLQTAQVAMRHSDPALTSNVYTDPRLLDVHGALEVLPELPLEGEPQAECQLRTGTDDRDVFPAHAPIHAPNPDNSGQLGSIADKTEGRREDYQISPELEETATRAVSEGVGGGGDEGIRTLDLLSAIQALSRTELRPHRVKIIL